MKIKDSGERREFKTGAVRDLAEGKGRFDLMPIDVMEGLFQGNEDDLTRLFLANIDSFINEPKVHYLYGALSIYINDNYENSAMAMLELAKHFEEGCKKYGDRNWQLGVPIHCYIDSALRHYFKHKAGWTDEPHDRAVMWNLMCCIWTCEHKPELFEAYKKEVGGE